MIRARLRRARRAIAYFRCDLEHVFSANRRRGARLPRLAALGDPSVWVLALLRARSVLRATIGASLGTSIVLRVVFHVDVWTDEIGPGLRLPHAFSIVIGDGVSLGRDCTLLHGVTIQHGAGTYIGDGAVLANGVTVLAGASIGAGALVGAHSVVRGQIPPRSVAVGAPARIVRAARGGEARVVATA